MEALDLPQSSRSPRSSSRLTLDLALRYPARWQAPVNPLGAAVEQRTAAWLRQLGIIVDAEGMARFEAMSVAAYGGFPFPFADEAKLEVITRFSTLWIFYDDIIEGAGEEQERLLAAAIRGEPNAVFGGDPCIRGWWEIARQYRRAMSPAWLARHAARYMDWLASVRHEAALMRRARETGVWPTTEAYLDLRQVTIGVYPTLDFIEYVTGEELPEAVRQNPTFQAIERLVAEVVSLLNDLFGFSKDRRAGWLNAVVSMAAETGISLRDAMTIVVAMHDRRIGELAQLSRELLEDASLGPLVERWLGVVHHMVHGFARWHEMAPRYSRTHTFDDGLRMKLVMRYV